MEKKIVHRLKEYLQAELHGMREFQISISDHGASPPDAPGEV
jgi:hypothetical protein